MFHHGRHKGIGAVCNGIGFCLNGILEKFIYEDRSLRRHIHGCGHIVHQHLFIMDHLHGTPPKDIGRPHHEGITNSLRHLKGFFKGAGHS